MLDESDDEGPPRPPGQKAPGAAAAASRRLPPSWGRHRQRRPNERPRRPQRRARETPPHDRRAAAATAAEADTKPPCRAREAARKTCPVCDSKGPSEGALRPATWRLEEAACAAARGEPDSDSDDVFDEAAATRDAKMLKVAELRAALGAAGADTEGLKAEC